MQIKALENNNFLPIEQYILKFFWTKLAFLLLQNREEEKSRKPFYLVSNILNFNGHWPLAKEMTVVFCHS